MDIRDVDDTRNPITVIYVDCDGDWQSVTITLSASDWKMYNCYFQSDAERSAWLQDNLSHHINSEELK